MMRYCHVASPVGELLLAADEKGLRSISFPTSSHAAKPGQDWQRSEEPFGDVIAQLRAYFKGDLACFDLALAPVGTPFQLAVWSALSAIPYGETVSYGEIARRVGRPTAYRAVGAANGRNPIPIVIPCHRVVGGDGSLTGFGGGLAIKSLLLNLEARRREALRSRPPADALKRTFVDWPSAS